MVIEQGEIYWVALGEPGGSEPGYRHPHIVIQNNLFNSSKINTIVMCSLTSNLKRGLSPGNVVLRKGEAGLPKKSVVNITQIYTVDRNDLCEKIGKVTKERIVEILKGIQLLTEPREL
ncbi:MAG: type II toxin-antitoxin system PemK/MazF family toxin [Desulfobacula sp.]|uniref:type II toxin-antitoxin system PemK/MazF family toxin n=1 Tax=Desulfobacula sp. TaxID=2593537 RepID=UPI0025C1C438|nr:type II toxin-antitoxin system PemK/MazF family toxin [Desulfobacula sp.]MCD4718517.1 type II toxin-antitoxin system PemK/MazF family toxin [Desulfobacula sp.]